MDPKVIKAERREPAGRRAAGRVRTKGLVPGIIYGHGETPVPVAVDREELTRQIHHGAHLVDLELDGTATKLLVKDVQYDHMNERIVHVDLARVRLDERVKVTVPLRFRGTPVGVRAEGGQLLTPLAGVEVECLVIAIPDEIRVNVAEMKIGDHLTLGKLELPEGVRLLGNPEQVVAVVTERKVEEVPVAAVAEAEAGPAEPEVITEKKPTEEEAEGEEEKGKGKGKAKADAKGDKKEEKKKEKK